MNKKKLEIRDIQAPFDFGISSRLYASYKFPELIDVVEDGKYYRVLEHAGKMILVIMQCSEDIENPWMDVEIVSEDEIEQSDIDYVENRIRWMFGLDEDLKPFYKFIKEHDPVLSDFIDKLYGLRAPATPDVFEAFFHVIIEQQISFDFAGQTKARIIEKYAKTMEYEGRKFYAFPSPEILANAAVEDLRELKTSTRKAEYIIDTAKGIVDGTIDLEKMLTLSNAEVIENMSKIRGVGVWTSEMTMVRGMRKLDAVPADDVALKKLISDYYCDGVKVTSEEARALTDKYWGEYRGHASYYLMYGGRIKQFEKKAKK